MGSVAVGEINVHRTVPMAESENETTTKIVISS